MTLPLAATHPVVAGPFRPETVADALGRATDGQGRIFDAVTGGPAPLDHYAQTFTALALHCRGERATADWRRVLAYWVEQPPQRHGHAPFNRLALQLLSDRLQPEDKWGRTLVRHGLSRCPLERRYPSNNWALLAQATRLGEATSTAARRTEARRLLAMAGRWTTAAGGFRDFPDRPRSRFATTPAAYHLKYLLCLWLAWCQAPQPTLEEEIRRALDWTGLIADERNGYCGGLGRSAHSLFGDTALLVVLRGLAEASAEPEAQVQCTALSGALERRLARQQRDDGLLWLNPSLLPAKTGGWDGYMALTVYNAWAAGLLLAQAHGAPRLRAPAPLGGAWPATGRAAASGEAPGGDPANGKTAIRHDPEAGVARIRTGRWDLMLCTRGQPVQGYGAREADFRQGAHLPFHLTLDGEPLLPPPLRIALTELAAEPALAGWSPLVEHDGAWYGLIRADQCVLEHTPDGVVTTSRGGPAALVRPRGAGAISRLREAVDWRLFNGRLRRGAALQPPRLAGHYWSMRLTIDTNRAQLTWRIELRGHPGSKARIPSLFAQPLLATGPRGANRPAAAWRGVTGTEPPPGPPRRATGPLGPYWISTHPPLAWPERDTVYEYLCQV